MGGESRRARNLAVPIASTRIIAQGDEPLASRR